MTFAPATLVALGRYWTAHGGVNLGVVGDSAHQSKGVSYHLGRSQLVSGAYSAQTARDKAGLTDAASAIDLGRLDGSLVKLRAFSRWLVLQAQADAPGCSDIREIIYSPDGKVVLRWDRERGYASAARPGEADSSHLAHTHLSFYRDSEQRSKVGLFEPYFAPPKEVDHMLTPSLDPSEFRPLTGVKVKAGTRFYRQASTTSDSVGLNDASVYPLYGNNNASTVWRGLLVNTATFYADGKARQTIGYVLGTAIAETIDLPIPLHDEIVNVRSEVSDIRTIVTDLSSRVDRALDALA